MHAAFSAEYVRSMTKQPDCVMQCFSKSRLPLRSLTEQEYWKLTTSVSDTSLLKKSGTDISALGFRMANLQTNLKSPNLYFYSEIWCF